MKNLIITSPSPNQLVSGIGHVSWVDMIPAEDYEVKIVLDDGERKYSVSKDANNLEVNWDSIPCSNGAKIIVKRGSESSEIWPVIIPRHLPPTPVMTMPMNGERVWSEVVVGWEAVEDENVDGMQFEALVQIKQNDEWKVIRRCKPSDGMALIDSRSMLDGPAVIRVVFSNEVGETSSSTSTIHVLRQGGHYIDTKPPLVDVSHVVSGGKVTFSLVGSDSGSSVSMLRMKQDDEEWGEWMPFSKSFDAAVSEDGTHRFFFQFVDHAGNMAESATRMFREVHHNATICSKVGKNIVAGCDSLVITPGKNVISVPGKVVCLGSYKGVTVACVNGENESYLVQASDPPVILWAIPRGKPIHMVEGHGSLYIGCDDGNVFSFCNGAGFLSYIADKITSMSMVNGSLVIGCAKQGLICCNGTTWEKL